MLKTLRYTLVLALLPAMALAQDKDQDTCPATTLSLNLDLSSLQSEVMANLEDLNELKQLALLEVPLAMPELKELAKLNIAVQTGNAGAEAAFDAEKRRTIEKTFKVNGSDVLGIENEWGKVHVNTWDRNEIRVKVDIIARASSEAIAQEMLNNVSVMESRQGSTYAFRTKLAPMHINGRNNSKGLEINYTVYMPENNAVVVKNSFGDIYLASLKGKADIDLRYGALKCDRLANAGNSVKLAYGSGSCTYFNGGNISVAYADMKVGEAGGLQGSSKYSDFKIGSLEETMEMDIKYGSFRIDNISKNIRRISLDTGFTPVNLHFADNAAFNFDVNVRFGNFNVDKSLVTITSLEKSYTSAEYKGRFGGASPKGVVSINSKYGDVKFTK
ncbi:hypothetical protein [Pontibacter actiniarum]|nr:hypothetical protein [Pontibacter actiniarum]